MTQVKLNVTPHCVMLRVFTLFSYVCEFMAPMNVTGMPLALFPFCFETSYP